MLNIHCLSDLIIEWPSPRFPPYDRSIPRGFSEVSAWFQRNVSSRLSETGLTCRTTASSRWALSWEHLLLVAFWVNSMSTPDIRSQIVVLFHLNWHLFEQFVWPANRASGPAHAAAHRTLQESATLSRAFCSKFWERPFQNSQPICASPPVRHGQSFNPC